MENKMLECFALLDLCDGDRISLVCSSHDYTITSNGLEDEECDVDWQFTVGLLNGSYTWSRLPWKPREGDEYWFIEHTGEPWNSVFIGDWLDMMKLYCGNYARTEKQILAKMPEIAKKLLVEE